MIGRYRLMVEAAPSAMLIVDAGGKIALANQRAEVLFGYEKNQLTGQHVDELVPDSVRESHAQLRERFLSRPEARPMGLGHELFARRRDGSLVPVEIGLNPIDTELGPFTLASIVDTTERKRAEERFRLVVEAAPSGIIMIDATRRITLVNHLAEELLGYARGELVGMTLEAIVPDRFRSSHQGQVNHFFRQPEARPMGANRELVARRKDGSEVPVEIGLSPLETSEGPCVLASLIDITERLRAESAMARLAAIVDSSADAILSSDAQGTILSWNRGATELLGYTAEEMVGRPVACLVPEDRGPDEQEALRRVRGGESIEPLETVRLGREGPRQVSLRLSAIRDRRGELEGFSWIARDISQLKAREEELKRSNRELEQFAYVASHDLQEPLRMVASYTELLAERYGGKLDEKADKYIHYASDGARRMQRMVSDLLAFSRVATQGRALEPLDSARPWTDAMRLLQGRIDSSQAELEVGPLPVVLGDAAQLRQLFQNLLSNALKFRGEEPPRIRVEARRRGAYWEFSLADNGIGLDMRFSERIFQMFQRLHEQGRYEGSGIGLAIAKRIVERHGGKLWVESAPGAGTTFLFTLRDGGQS